MMRIKSTFGDDYDQGDDDNYDDDKVIILQI